MVWGVHWSLCTGYRCGKEGQAGEGARPLSTRGRCPTSGDDPDRFSDQLMAEWHAASSHLVSLVPGCCKPQDSPTREHCLCRSRSESLFLLVHNRQLEHHKHSRRRRNSSSLTSRRSGASALRAVAAVRIAASQQLLGSNF